MNHAPEREAGSPNQTAAGDRLPGAKVAFVHNFVSHYRTKVFEALSRMCDVEFYFYSDGGEWYWQRSHGTAKKAGFVHHSLRGFWLGRTRITPGLVPSLLFRKYTVFIKCINGKFALPLTYAIARLRRIPFVLWTGLWHRLDTPLHRLVFPLTRHIYRNADAVVAYGEHVRRYLISEGVDPDRIFLAAQAVDNERYSRMVTAAEQQQLRSQHQFRGNSKIVLYLGRLESGKGLEYLVEAFAQIRCGDATLVLCGAGQEESNLRALVSRLGIANRVRFTGHVPTDQAILFYSLSWVAVLPSVTTPTFKEPWGLTVNEVFNQGVPVIATDAVGAAAGGLLQNGRNGFVVPERNSAALRDALETVLGSVELRDRLGNNARRDVAAWTQERMAAGFRDAVAFVTARREKRVARPSAVFGLRANASAQPPVAIPSTARGEQQ